MRCLPMCRQARIIAAGNIMREAHIICPTGQTSLKKALLSQCFFLGGGWWIRFSAEKPRRLRHATGMSPRAAFRIHHHKYPYQDKRPILSDESFTLVGDGGFEPPKALPADLQSVPFGHSGNPPYSIGAGGRIRTPDLLITNQLLYQLSYTSIFNLVLPTPDKLIDGVNR